MGSELCLSLAPEQVWVTIVTKQGAGSLVNIIPASSCWTYSDAFVGLVIRLRRVMKVLWREKRAERHEAINLA